MLILKAISIAYLILTIFMWALTILAEKIKRNLNLKSFLLVLTMITLIYVLASN